MKPIGLIDQKKGEANHFAFFMHDNERSQKKARQRLAFVTRIGFKPMTPNLEGLCSIQLSYRAGNTLLDQYICQSGGKDN